MAAHRFTALLLLALLVACSLVASASARKMLGYKVTGGVDQQDVLSFYHDSELARLFRDALLEGQQALKAAGAR